MIWFFVFGNLNENNVRSSFCFYSSATNPLALRVCIGRWMNMTNNCLWESQPVTGSVRVTEYFILVIRDEGWPWGPFNWAQLTSGIYCGNDNVAIIIKLHIFSMVSWYSLNELRISILREAVTRPICGRVREIVIRRLGETF